jgi:glycosyltransferase involved in cell wall biosynthesis
MMPRFVKKYGCIVVEGGLPARGRNAGAKVATSDWYLFLDADVRPLSDRFIERLMREVEDRRLDMTAAPHKMLSKKPSHAFYAKSYNAIVEMRARGDAPVATTTCFLASARLHRRINGFDERWAFFEDANYIQRGYALGYRFRPVKVKIGVLPRRLEKDGLLKVAKMAYKADKIAKRGQVIDDIAMIDSDYFNHA